MALTDSRDSDINNTDHHPHHRGPWLAMPLVIVTLVIVILDLVGYLGPGPETEEVEVGMDMARAIQQTVVVHRLPQETTGLT